MSPRSSGLGGRAVVGLAVLVGTTLGTTLGCAQKPPPPARNLVLVTIDTLRADRLGAYGRKDVATPRLDRIAAEGAMAEEATTHVPLTRPSHVTLFTGRLPSETGVRDNMSPAVVPSFPLLAESLQKAGFRTGAFVSSVVLDATSGLKRGFDTYGAVFPASGREVQFLSTVQKKGDVTTAEAIAWLEGVGVGKANTPPPRIFLWLHLYDPHDPYEPPEPYASRYAGRLYDGEVAWTDELVGRVDDALTRLGLGPETLLLVTSDHGEGLGEHGETLHGFFTYQTTLRVPFLVRGPRVKAGTRLTSTVRLVDVFPTVLDLLGMAPATDARLSGESLGAALRGEEKTVKTVEPVTYAESLVPLLHFGWSDLRVVRAGRWKYIQAPRPELYDLAADPGENTNLAPAQTARAAAMRGALGRFLDDERKAALPAAEAGAPSADLLEKLGALGYVGGGGPAETATPGADPKDKIEDFRFANELIREGLVRLHAKDYRASVDRLEAVLRRGISSFEIHFYLARGLQGLGRFAEASSHYTEATRRQPAHGEAWEGLAACRAASGDKGGALDALHKGQAVIPNQAGLRLAEARLLRDLGRKADARRAYEAALPLVPRNAGLRLQLGELLREMGESEPAIARLREAVDLDPADASAWNSLGMTLGGNGRPAEAERCFREAVRLDDKNHRHAYNLGLILLRQGRGEEARPWFEKTLALDPRFAPARDQLKALPSR